MLSAEVDRLDRRQLVLASQGTLAACALVLALLIMVRWVEPWHVFLLAFMSGTAVGSLLSTRLVALPP